jgi:drug/metabolite transporter (DMT)-like permease
MFLVALLFSFSAVLGKLSINHSSALFFSISFFLSFNLFILLTLLFFRTIRLKTFKTDWLKGLIAGFLFYLHVLFHGLAIAITKAVYMISVKRMSILFSIVYGGLVFHEKNIFIRFLGAFLMFTGVVLILLMGR